MKLTDVQARGKACEIVARLRNRGGFEPWWLGNETEQDAELQEEIIQEMMEVIQREE